MALNDSHSCIRGPVPTFPIRSLVPTCAKHAACSLAGHASWDPRPLAPLFAAPLGQAQAPSEGQPIAVAPGAVPVMVAPAGSFWCRPYDRVGRRLRAASSMKDHR